MSLFASSCLSCYCIYICLISLCYQSFEQQRRTCHTAVRRLYFATGHIVPGNFFYLILRIHFLSIYTYRLVIKVRSDLFAVHICGIIPVSICRNIFKFLSVSCCCQSINCIVSHHQRRLCNSTKECSILYSCFNDRTSVETNTDNIALPACVRTKNVQVSVSSKNTLLLLSWSRTEDSDAVFLRTDGLSLLLSKALPPKKGGFLFCWPGNSYLDNNVLRSASSASAPLAAFYIELVTFNCKLFFRQPEAVRSFCPMNPPPRCWMSRPEASRLTSPMNNLAVCCRATTSLIRMCNIIFSCNRTSPVRWSLYKLPH